MIRIDCSGLSYCRLTRGAFISDLSHSAQQAADAKTPTNWRRPCGKGNTGQCCPSSSAHPALVKRGVSLRLTMISP
jgi:hypothetical protein